MIADDSASRRHEPGAALVLLQVAVLDMPAALGMHANALAAIAVDLASADGRITALVDCNARRSIGEDGTLQHLAAAFVLHRDPKLLPVVNLTAANQRVAILTDGDLGRAMAKDIAVLQGGHAAVAD